MARPRAPAVTRRKTRVRIAGMHRSTHAASRRRGSRRRFSIRSASRCCAGSAIASTARTRPRARSRARWVLRPRRTSSRCCGRLGYEAAFRAAFPSDAEPLSTRNYGRAIEAYEATLVTPAPFDRFLGGDASALTVRQKAGLRFFMDRGCAVCHHGPLLGGNTAQRFGVVKDYWLATGSDKRRHRSPGDHDATRRTAMCSAFRCCATSREPPRTSTTARWRRSTPPCG